MVITRAIPKRDSSEGDRKRFQFNSEEGPYNVHREACNKRVLGARFRCGSGRRASISCATLQF